MLFMLVVALLAGAAAGIDEDDMLLFARRFEDLERQVAEQKETIANQAEQLLDQSKTMTELKNAVRVQEKTIFDLKQIVTTQQLKQLYQDDLLKSRVTAQKSSKRFVVENYGTVAFHATVGGSRDNIDINRTLVFDSVKLNIGGGYHPSGGIFIAPVAGIYIFSTSVTFNNNHDESHMIIEKNGAEIAGAYGNARNGLHEQGSVTVVMELKVGDEVYVSNQRHNDVIVYGDNLSSFMGCMITEV